MRDFDTIAAVDLGSNSFHMIIGRVVGDELIIVDALKEMVRLAAGLDDDNTLSPEAIERAEGALEKFGERLRPLPEGAVRVVGTNTLRQARNSRAFLARAEECLGHPVEIIAGSEEARLIYLGVAHSVEQLWGRRLVVDIGGGSTELIVGTGFEPELRESKYMGCVSFSRRFFPDGRITRESFRQAEIAARQELAPSVPEFRALGWELAIGASGTIKAVRDIAASLGLDKAQEITRPAMKQIRKRAIAAETTDALSLPGLSDERRPVFVGGLAILLAIFKSLEVERMTASDGALREGVLYDLLGRIHDHDVREETIRLLAQKYLVDEEHAQRVEQTSLELLGSVRATWGLDSPIDDAILRWAARIHEIGLAISHSRYHKHGSYLVENADLPGFSRQDQQLLWALVRSHRRKFKLHRFENIAAPFRKHAPKLAVLLRLGVVLNRARDPAVVPPYSVAAPDAKRIHVDFDGALDELPLMRADLEEEAAMLQGSGFSLTFS